MATVHCRKCDVTSWNPPDSLCDCCNAHVPAAERVLDQALVELVTERDAYEQRYVRQRGSDRYAARKTAGWKALQAQIELVNQIRKDVIAEQRRQLEHPPGVGAKHG